MHGQHACREENINMNLSEAAWDPADEILQFALPVSTLIKNACKP